MLGLGDWVTAMRVGWEGCGQWGVRGGMVGCVGVGVGVGVGGGMGVGVGVGGKVQVGGWTGRKKCGGRGNGGIKGRRGGGERETVGLGRMAHFSSPPNVTHL